MFIYHTVRVFATVHTDSITTYIIAFKPSINGTLKRLSFFIILCTRTGLLEFVTDRTIAMREGREERKGGRRGEGITHL